MGAVNISMKRARLQRLYFTGDLGRMAVARRDGGIYWAEEIGTQRGILLFDDLQAAAEYQKSQAGYPFVVGEFGRQCVDVELLERVANAVPHYSGDYRAWVYPQAIGFDTVRWHTYREVAEQPEPFTIVIPNTPDPNAQPLPTGVIVLAQS